MVFQPMLAEVAGGNLAPHHVINPIRLLCPDTENLKGTVESVDWERRSLTLFAGPLAGRCTVRFLHLVVALGATIDLSRIPGMPEHAFLMQNVGDAMLLRNTIISRMEEANLVRNREISRRLLTFVVVGGGYSGVETAGQILDLVRGAAALYRGIDARDIRVVLIHSRNHLLPTLDLKLSEYCARLMRQRGVDIRLETRVRAVTATQVILSDGTRIDASTVVSTVGNAPHPVVLDLIEKNDLPNERGRILVDETMQVPGYETLWSAGDCAAVPYVKGGYCPQTAQFAYRQGTLLGKNIAARLNHREPQAFDFPGLGELATIGHQAAVASILGFNFSGIFAWFLWRTIYLLKLPRFDRKLRVVADWTFELFFPRDITQTNPRFTKVLKEIHLEPGDILFHAGEPAFSLYIVRDGAIELLDGDEIVSTLRQGDYFGERALLSDRQWLFTARAGEVTQIVSLPASVFHQIVGAGGSLGRLFERSAQRYQSREVIDSLARSLPASVLDRPVAGIMQTDLITFQPDQTIRDALETIRNQPHSSYPMVEASGVFAGMLRREDFHDYLRQSPDAGTASLNDVGITQVPTVASDAPVRDVLEQLIRSGTNKLIVLDAGRKLCGIVTVMDLAAARMESDDSG